MWWKTSSGGRAGTLHPEDPLRVTSPIIPGYPRNLSMAGTLHPDNLSAAPTIIQTILEKGLHPEVNYWLYKSQSAVDIIKDKVRSKLGDNHYLPIGLPTQPSGIFQKSPNWDSLGNNDEINCLATQQKQQQ